jgi:hypothetical protein
MNKMNFEEQTIRLMKVTNQRNLKMSQNKKIVSGNVAQLQLGKTSSFEIKILRPKKLENESKQENHIW